MNAIHFKTTDRKSTGQARVGNVPCRHSINLVDDERVELHDARGTTVKALNGTVWITQDGDVRDVVLETGETFILDRDGKTLLSPIGKAEICLADPADGRPAQPRSANGSRFSLSSVRAIFA